MNVKLLKWWQPMMGNVSSKETGWYDLGLLAPVDELSFVQQIGQKHQAGRYLMLAEDGSWWRELTVTGDTTWREAT